MITSVNDWLAFLKSSDPLIGFPLVICGVALMVFGWRMWKVCVALAFGVIGMVLATSLTPSSNIQWLYAVLAGVVLGAAGFKLVDYSIGVLGGIIGAAAAMQALADVRVTDTVAWLLCGIAFLAAGALAHTYKRLVVIGVTSTMGAILTISGLTAFVMAAPSTYGAMHALIRNSFFLSAFILLVPSVMSFFYQIAEVRRSHGEL